jgi:hypothetical protein
MVAEKRQLSAFTVAEIGAIQILVASVPPYLPEE